MFAFTEGLPSQRSQYFRRSHVLLPAHRGHQARHHQVLGQVSQPLAPLRPAPRKNRFRHRPSRQRGQDEAGHGGPVRVRTRPAQPYTTARSHGRTLRNVLAAERGGPMVRALAKEGQVSGDQHRDSLRTARLFRAGTGSLRAGNEQV